MRPDADAERRPALRDGHRRQEHQPRRRDQPDRPAVPAGDAQARPEQLRARGSASTGRPATAAPACTAATASTTTASRCRSSRSSAGWTGARCRSKCAPATSSSSTRRPASFRRSPRRWPTRSPGSSCPAPARRASTSSTTRMQNPSVQQFNLGFERELPCGVVLRVDGVHNLGTHFIIGRTDRRGVQPGRRRTRSRRQPRVERQHALRRAARERRAAQHAPRLPRVLHVLPRRSTTPTTIRFPFANGPIDPNEPAPRVRPDAERPAASLHGRGVGAGPGGVSRGAHPDPGVRRADGHPDAGRAVAHPGVPAQRRRPPVQDRRRAQQRP